MIKRHFYRVGNGLFALEETDGIVSVYDCGGQRQGIIDAAIDKARRIIRGDIDNLFISHYDLDHVNGIMHLLGLFRVKRIILPMIPDLTRVLNYGAVNSGYYYAGFIQDPVSFVSRVYPDTTVIQIGSNEESESRIYGNEIDLNGVRNNVTFPGEAVTFIQNGRWQYVVYNRRVMTYGELSTFMQKLGLTANATMSDIMDVLRATKANSIKSSLAQVFSQPEMDRINEYSMAVWSGRAETLDCGCLYTGDYKASSHMADFKAVYGNFIPRSEIIQIPHHGSIYNFHKDICSPSAMHVISASAGPYKSRKIVNPDAVIKELARMNYKESDTRGSDIGL